MRSTVLLTGKTGQLGSELCRLLPELGNVVAPERDELDLGKPDAIRRMMRAIKPQLVINAAAYTAVDAAESDEPVAFAVNAEAPRQLALEAKEIGAVFVHFSTDYIFDGSKKAPYLETDAPNPVNAYGRTKLAGEQAIRESGAAHLLFRASWLYATHGRNFLRTVLRLATERDELRIVDDQVGAPTCAQDLAQATTSILRTLVESKEGISPDVSGTYHMTAAGHVTWYEFARAILDEARGCRQSLPWLDSVTQGHRLRARTVVPISTEEYRAPARRPAYSVLSNARLAERFGVNLPDWRTQLHRCFEG